MVGQGDDRTVPLSPVSDTNGVLYTYTYDAAGNILTAFDGTQTHEYTYGDTSWADLLTAYDGQSITYDAIGNPTSYFNGTRWAFTWQNGRRLATASDGTTNLSFAYDADGMRTAKTVNGVTHSYIYASGKLLRETYGTNTLDFFYDATGMPYAIKYNGTLYYYITNLQGDILHIVNGSGEKVVSYEYGPYGQFIEPSGTMAETLGAANPLRYRGYYYDAELEMYYLQSRYYDPTVGRFINADAYASTGQGFIGHNMYTYCVNNPVNFADHKGYDPFGLLAVGKDVLWVVVAVFIVIILAPPVLEFTQKTLTTINQQISIYVEEQKQIITEKLEQSLVYAEPQSQPPKTHLHHIVPQNDRRTPHARQILEYLFPCGTSIEENLIEVEARVHHRLHTNAYCAMVEYYIIDAFYSSRPFFVEQQESVKQALKSLKAFIKTLSMI